MAEENRGRGYCPTYGEGNGSRQLDVAITMVNIETAENKKSIVMSPKYNEAEKADMMQRCNDIRKSCTFGFMVLLILMAVTVLSILCTILFGEDIYKSLFSKWYSSILRLKPFIWWLTFKTWAFNMFFSLNQIMHWSREKLVENCGFYRMRIKIGQQFHNSRYLYVRYI